MDSLLPKFMQWCGGNSRDSQESLSLYQAPVYTEEDKPQSTALLLPQNAPYPHVIQERRQDVPKPEREQRVSQLPNIDCSKP